MLRFRDFTTAEALRKASHGSELTDREKHLIGIAVAASHGCVMCSSAKTKAAVEAGIPLHVIVEAVDLAAQVTAGVTVATALEGINRSGVEDECSSGACNIPPERQM